MASMGGLWPNFHLEVANQPDCLWAISDPDLYGQAFTNQLVAMENWCSVCQSLDHNSAVYPRHQLKCPVSPKGKARNLLFVQQ